MMTSYQTMSRPVELFPKSLFSVGEAAAYLGVSASTVRRRIAAGALRAQRWGRSWIMWRADLDGYCRGFADGEGDAGEARRSTWLPPRLVARPRQRRS